MTYSISKDFDFAAAHHLPQLPEDHQCRRVHGHNYRVRLELTVEELDRFGFVVDYGDLSFFGDYLREELDHRDLNEVLGFAPTAERLALVLHDFAWDRLNRDQEEEVIVAVGVSETPKTWAWYTR